MNNNSSLAKITMPKNTNDSLATLKITYNPKLTSLAINSSKNLTTIVANNNGLTSLTTPKNYVKRLICYSNKLTSLDVRDSYTYLDCHSNKLTTLNGLSSNAVLDTIDASYNQLASLTFNTSRAIAHINLSSNQLTQWKDAVKSTTFLNVSHNSIAGQFYQSGNATIVCSYNKITDILLRDNVSVTCDNNMILAITSQGANMSLTRLSCGNNGMTILKLSSFPALKTLYCNNNSIASLDVSSNANLEVLNCSSNSISSLDLSNNTALRQLWCTSMKLKKLDLTKCTNLERLYASSNKIESIDLSKCTKLKVVDVENNWLASIDLSSNKLLTASTVKLGTQSPLAYLSSAYKTNSLAVRCLTGCSASSNFKNFKVLGKSASFSNVNSTWFYVQKNVTAPMVLFNADGTAITDFITYDYATPYGNMSVNFSARSYVTPANGDGYTTAVLPNDAWGHFASDEDQYGKQAVYEVLKVKNDARHTIQRWRSLFSTSVDTLKMRMWLPKNLPVLISCGANKLMIFDLVDDGTVSPSNDALMKSGGGNLLSGKTSDMTFAPRYAYVFGKRTVRGEEKSGFFTNLQSSLKIPLYTAYLHVNNIENLTNAQSSYFFVWEQNIPVGDVNLDGMINITDMTVLNNMILGMQAVDVFADLDGSNNLNTSDTGALLNIMLDSSASSPSQPSGGQ